MEKETDFDPADLPQEAMMRKEVFQHPQAADTGKPLDGKDKRNSELSGKEAKRSSKEDGLNESARTGGGEGPDGQS